MVTKFNKLSLLAATCGACFALSSAMAFEPSNEAEKLMVEWLEANSCGLTQEEFMDKAMSGPGVSGSDLMKARRAMTKSGVIRKGAGNSMTLTAGDACADVKLAEPTYDSGSEKDVLVAKLIGVFEANKCVLTERRARTLFEAEGLTRAQLDIAGEALDNDGAFKDVDGGLQLTIGKCADFVAETPKDDDRTRVMAMFEQNGCSLKESDMPDVAQQFQVTRKQFRAVAGPMEEEGAFRESGDRMTLLVGDICGDKTASAPGEDTPEAASKLLIALAEENNCALTEDLVETFMTANEDAFSPSSLDDAFDLLEDNGSIIIADDRQSARLVKGDTCEKAAQETVAAYEPKSDDERTIITMFEENGCSLNEDALPALAKKYNITKKAFKPAARALIGSGIMSANGDDITLLGGKCADGGKAAPAGDDKRATVIRVFEENACAMTQDVATAKLEAVGLDLDEDRDLVRSMIKDGLITLSEDRDTATLVSGDVCGKAQEAGPAATGDKRSKIIALFEQNGCRMTEDQAKILFPTVGMDIESEADVEVIGQMFEDGDIIEGSSDQAILVTGDVCEGQQAGSTDMRDVIEAAFFGNDCEMTEDEFEKALADSAFDVDEAGEIVEAMIESGDATYDRDTKKAKLLVGACAQ